MKKSSLLLLFIFAIFVNTNAQIKTLENLSNYKTKNFGTMYNSNNSVKGYYVFYEGQKLKKKKIEYVLKILDDNLNTVLIKKIVESKYFELQSVAFNQQQLMIKFWDRKENMYQFRGLNLKGEQVSSYSIEITSKDLKAEELMAKQKMFNQLFSVDNKGFVFLRFNKQKKIGYHLHFFPKQK